MSASLAASSLGIQTTRLSQPSGLNSVTITALVLLSRTISFFSPIVYTFSNANSARTQELGRRCASYTNLFWRPHMIALWIASLFVAICVMAAAGLFTSMARSVTALSGTGSIIETNLNIGVRG